jgi:hypothetical protein
MYILSEPISGCLNLYTEKPYCSARLSPHVPEGRAGYGATEDSGGALYQNWCSQSSANVCKCTSILLSICMIVTIRTQESGIESSSFETSKFEELQTVIEALRNQDIEPAIGYALLTSHHPALTYTQVG